MNRDKVFVEGLSAEGQREEDDAVTRHEQTSHNHNRSQRFIRRVPTRHKLVDLKDVGTRCRQRQRNGDENFQRTEFDEFVVVVFRFCVASSSEKDGEKIRAGSGSQRIAYQIDDECQKKGDDGGEG